MMCNVDSTYNLTIIDKEQRLNLLYLIKIVKVYNIYGHYKTVCHFQLLRNLLNAFKCANLEAEMDEMSLSCQQGCKFDSSTST